METLTLGQDTLDTVSQDDGGSLDVHAVEQVGGLGRSHPMTAGALYEVDHLQGMIVALQPAGSDHLGEEERSMKELKPVKKPLTCQVNECWRSN